MSNLASVDTNIADQQSSRYRISKRICGEINPKSVEMHTWWTHKTPRPTVELSRGGRTDPGRPQRLRCAATIRRLSTRCRVVTVPEGDHWRIRGASRG